MKTLVMMLLLAAALAGCGGGDAAVVPEPEPTPVNPAQRFAGTWTGYFDTAPVDCAVRRDRTVTWVISADPEPNVRFVGEGTGFNSPNPRLFLPDGEHFEWFDTVGLQSWTTATTRFQLTGHGTARLTVDTVKVNIGVSSCSSMWIADLKRDG